MIASMPGAKEQGMAESRTEALTWGAWFAAYIDGLRAQRSTSFDIPDHFENFLNSLEGELPELAGEVETETADSAAKTAELSRQLKESRKALREAEQGMRRLQERICPLEIDTLRERSELSRLR